MIMRANRNTYTPVGKYWLDKKVISSAGRVTKYKEFPYKYNKFIQTEEMREFKSNRGDYYW